MSQANDIELKVSKVKLKLLEEIKIVDRQIEYHIMEAAKSMLDEIVSHKKETKNKTVEIPVNTFDELRQLLYCIKESQMYGYKKGNEYLKTCYHEKHIKEAILNQL